MLPLLGAVLPPLIGGLTSMFGAEQQNKEAAQQASAQRSWEERMSNTSWQRGVADMKAAGINPMLSFMQGGASTPSSSAAPVVNPTGELGGIAAGAASSALQAMQTKAQLDLLKAQKDAADAAALRSRAEGNKINTYWLNSDTIPTGDKRPLMAAHVDALIDNAKAAAAQARASAQSIRADLPARGVVGSKWSGFIRALSPGVQAAGTLLRGVF